MTLSAESHRWEQVARVSDVLPGGRLLITHTEPEVLLLCLAQGVYRAVDPWCTHAAFSLEDGPVEGEVLVCPHHQARFCLRTGAALCPPAYEPLQVYPVRITHEGQQIEVGFPQDVAMS